MEAELTINIWGPTPATFVVIGGEDLNKLKSNIIDYINRYFNRIAKNDPNYDPTPVVEWTHPGC